MISLMIGIMQSVKSQPAENNPLLKRASVEYQNLRFADAIKVLHRVLEKDPNNLRALEMIAESNRKIKNYDETVHWYGELCKQKSIKPEWALYYAEALASKQKYEESRYWYAKYSGMKPADRRANAFSKADLNLIAGNSGNYKIRFLNINSDDSEYSPMYYKNGLLFISNRPHDLRFVFQWDRTSYSDIYIVDDLKSIVEAEPSNATEEEKTGMPIRDTKDRSLIGLLKSSGEKEIHTNEEPYLLKGKVRSSYHEGPAALLPEGNLIFTRNNYISGKSEQSKTGINKLKLFTASGTEWEKITPFPYNNNEYSIGHPAVSEDGKMLIFASDMPNGFGGTDLYYCLRKSEGEKWGKPVNLGPEINTEGNEQFPYLHPNGKLYFSSTGHPGLGGLDIFEVLIKDMKAAGVPRNMGADINSSVDDFGFIQDKEEKTGFFSSNRRGNDDIYQFERVQFSNNLQEHFRETIIMDNPKENFGISRSEPAHVPAGTQMLSAGTQLPSSAENVITDTKPGTLMNLTQTESSKDSVMTNCIALKKNFTFENIYYDFNHSGIRTDAAKTLDRMAELMKKYPGINILSASHTDNRASVEYNNKLSLKRGESVRNYLVSKGIEKGRIEVHFYGESRLVHSCKAGLRCSESDQQKNRRTEFEVLLNGVNIAYLNCK